MEVRLTTVGATRFLTNPNDTFVGKSLEVYGEWSYGEVELLSKLLRRENNVVEIGANIGSHTVFIARDICPAGIVYAFEPRRLLFQMLCANLALNCLTNVFAFQKAIAGGNNFIDEGMLPAKLPANVGGFPIGTLKGDGERIEIIALDEMIDTLKTVTALKVDVEGWERDVLLGSQKVIDRDRPMLYVENDRVEKSRDLISFIMNMNYDLWWHIVPLFRPNNHARTTVNIFGNIASFNMLCLPRECKIQISGLKRIEDPEFHPLSAKSKDPNQPSRP